MADLFDRFTTVVDIEAGALRVHDCRLEFSAVVIDGAFFRFLWLLNNSDQSIYFSCLVSEVLSSRHPICPGGLHHDSDAGGYSVAVLNAIRLSQAH